MFFLAIQDGDHPLRYMRLAYQILWSIVATTNRMVRAIDDL